MSHIIQFLLYLLVNGVGVSEGEGIKKFIILYGCHKWSLLMFPSRNQKVLTSTHLCARLCPIMLCNVLVKSKVMDKFPQNSKRSSQF